MHNYGLKLFSNKLRGTQAQTPLQSRIVLTSQQKRFMIRFIPIYIIMQCKHDLGLTKIEKRMYWNIHTNYLTPDIDVVGRFPFKGPLSGQSWWYRSIEVSMIYTVIIITSYILHRPYDPELDRICAMVSKLLIYIYF